MKEEILTPFVSLSHNASSNSCSNATGRLLVFTFIAYAWYDKQFLLKQREAILFLILHSKKLTWQWHGLTVCSSGGPGRELTVFHLLSSIFSSTCF